MVMLGKTGTANLGQKHWAVLMFWKQPEGIGMATPVSVNEGQPAVCLSGLNVRAAYRCKISRAFFFGSTGSGID